MTAGDTLLALIGLPGSGKTTVGRMLARRLQLPFLDSDQEIERRMGCSIRQFFEEQGEARFRDIEAEVIDALTRSGPGVLSTGGGAVLRPENRARLHERCRVIYLHARPEDLARRLRRDSQRPLLQVDDPLKRLRELHAARDPLYRETAHDVLETGRPSVAMLVNMILMQLELAPQPAAGGTGPALGR